MSLFQAIEHGKDHKHHYKQYLYHRFWFQSCVNHNPRWCQCEWCKGNRLHNNKVREEKSLSLLRDYERLV